MWLLGVTGYKKKVLVFYTDYKGRGKSIAVRIDILFLAIKSKAVVSVGNCTCVPNVVYSNQRSYF